MALHPIPFELWQLMKFVLITIGAALALVGCIVALLVVLNHNAESSGNDSEKASDRNPKLAPGHESQRDDRPQARLARYIRQRRAYLFYVGNFERKPWRWIRVNPLDANTLATADGRRIPTRDVLGFIVAYTNGETLDSHLAFSPWPEGIHPIPMAQPPTVHYLEPAEYNNGARYAKVTFGAHPESATTDDRFATWFTNVSNRKLRITKFGAYYRKGKRYVLSTISGTFFTAEHFRLWYGLGNREWIDPGETVSDPNNYGGDGTLWAYWCETPTGETFIVAAIDK